MRPVLVLPGTPPTGFGSAAGYIYVDRRVQTDIRRIPRMYAAQTDVPLFGILFSHVRQYWLRALEAALMIRYIGVMY